MKIVWLCSFSNSKVRDHLEIGIPKIIRWMYKIATGHAPFNTMDFGVWNTNAIREFEKYDELELHVISSCSFLKKRLQEFEINGIHYHFYRDEKSEFLKMVCKQFFKPTNDEYKQNRRIIKKLIRQIQPDVVHMIGAENPQYSLALLDVPHCIPTIVQLQTLLNDPEFKDNFPIGRANYQYLSSVERKVLLRADYIGTEAQKFINIIIERIKPNAKFLSISIAVGEKINTSIQKKTFDFVYFASDISKSCDIAVEAFGLAYKKNSSITLDIVGGYTLEYKKQIDEIIDKYGIANAVTFEGHLATHEDVLFQIRKSRFALLPLKIDLTSGTVREAMSNGLPVITTDTGALGTQQLNKDYQSALISPKNDCQDIANKMLILLNDPILSESLRLNGYRLQQERYNNEVVVRKYIETYKLVLCK